VRILSEAFRGANLSYNREPRLVLKILNENRTIYIASANDIAITDPGAAILVDAVTTCGGSSQKVNPERGYSTIGSTVVGVAAGDQWKAATGASEDLTDLLRDFLVTYNDTITNNKAELYTGFKGLDFADYLKVQTLWVSQVDNGEREYRIGLSDVQRFTRKSVFSNLAKTQVDANFGPSELGDLLVGSTGRFERVDHSSVWPGTAWRDAPGEKVGYFTASGTTETGDSVEEVLRWTAKTADTFTIDRRGCFGTRPVTLEEGVTELKEFVYLDLPIPAMILAIQTGDLYGVPGETLPDHWHAGVTADLVDLNSYETIGADFWAFQPEFIGVSKESAKGFIAEQCLAPFNLLTVITQSGELRLKRFSNLPQNGTGELQLDYDSVTVHGDITRDAKGIRNVFEILWGWNFQSGEYARPNTYVDGDSIARNNGASDKYPVELKGVRNRNRNDALVVNQLAEGIRARFSEPRVTPKVTAPIRDAIELEVADVVGLNFPDLPDFAALDTLNASFEVQGLTWDFIAGTVDLELFGSSGTTTPLDLDAGTDVLTFDRTGWTNLDGWPGTTTVGELLTFTSAASLPSGQYYFDGDIRIDNGVTVTGGDRVVIDFRDLTIVGTGSFDLSEQGPAGTEGIFGGEDASQEGLYTGVAWFNRYYRRPRSGAAKVPAVNPAGVPSNTLAKVTEAGELVGLPDTLHGNGSRQGGTLYVRDSISQNGDTPGQPALKGGGGLALIGENFFFDSPGCINVSGESSDPDPRTDREIIAGSSYYAGVSGFGWPGAVLYYAKTRANPLPILSGEFGAVTARTGEWVEGAENPSFDRYHAPRDGDREYDTPADFFFPYLPPARGNGDQELNGLVSRTFRLSADAPFVPEPGVDIVDTAEAPQLSVEERVNTPRTPAGNVSALVVTALPQPGDAAFKYARIEYRLQGLDEWYPADYGITTESTIKNIVADGSTYEIRATAVNTLDALGGVATTTVTVSNVTRDTETSDGNADTDPDEAITLPDVKGLELVNRIDDAENWDQWKSPNAEFRWKKLSTTLGGTILALNGATDLHLEGYNVRITRTSGEILREEVVKDSTYVYTYDKNKKDTDGEPVRAFRIDVQAVATTGYVSGFTGFPVGNPAPAAPANVAVQTGYSSFNVEFGLPTDVDFVGCDFYLANEGEDPFTKTPTRISGNTVQVDGLPQGTTYALGLTSVDQFGTGNSTATLGVTTNSIDATDIEGLGPWALETDPVDLAFIGANMANDAVPSDKIVNLTAAKITAGQVVVQIDIGTGILLDGGNGIIQSINAGYVLTMGPHSIPALSSSDLIMSAWDGANSPFNIDSEGNMKLTSITASGLIALGSVTFGASGCQIVYDEPTDRTQFHLGDGGKKSLTFDTVTGELELGSEATLRGVRSLNTNHFFHYEDFRGVTTDIATNGTSAHYPVGFKLVTDGGAVSSGLGMQIYSETGAISGRTMDTAVESTMKVSFSYDITGADASGKNAYLLAGGKWMKSTDGAASGNECYGVSIEDGNIKAYFQHGTTRYSSTTSTPAVDLKEYIAVVRNDPTAGTVELSLFDINENHIATHTVSSLPTGGISTGTTLQLITIQLFKEVSTTIAATLRVGDFIIDQGIN